MTSLTSSRLTLRDIHLTDWPAFHRIFSDDCEFVEYGPFDEFQTREWLSHVIVTRYDSPRLVHHFAVELKATREVVGWIAAATFASITREWGLSYAVDKAHRGQGFMTEAVDAVVDYAFADLDAHRFYVDVDPENAPSIRVAVKCGFVLEGRMREKQFIRGKWRDMLHYAKVADDK